MILQTVRREEDEEDEEQRLACAIFPTPVHSACHQGGLGRAVKQRPTDTDGGC